MKMIYQRRGGPILSWASGYPPRQSRAADATALGLYEYVPTHPMPGAPEMVHGIEETIGSVQSMAGLAIGGYHGYKRTGSLGWTALWAVAGSIFPLFTGVVALAQGFAKPKHGGPGPLTGQRFK
jgi:hypothetical protein